MSSSLRDYKYSKVLKSSPNRYYAKNRKQRDSKYGHIWAKHNKQVEGSLFAKAAEDQEKNSRLVKIVTIQKWYRKLRFRSLFKLMMDRHRQIRTIKNLSKQLEQDLLPQKLKSMTNAALVVQKIFRGFKSRLHQIMT